MSFSTHTLRWSIPTPSPIPIPNPIPDIPGIPSLPDPSDIIKKAGAAATNIRDQIANGAADLAVNDINTVLDGFKDAIPPEVTEKGKQFVAKLEEVQKAIKDLQKLTPAELKRRILKEAENLCESYLNDKLEFIRQIGLEAVPVVKLDFNGTEMSINIKIYITEKDDKNDYETKWGVLIEVPITQKFKAELPSINLEFKLNDNWAKEKVDDLKQRIEDKKKELIADLISSIMQDYCPPLKALNEAMKVFG